MSVIRSDCDKCFHKQVCKYIEQYKEEVEKMVYMRLDNSPVVTRTCIHFIKEEYMR